MYIAEPRIKTSGVSAHTLIQPSTPYFLLSHTIHPFTITLVVEQKSLVLPILWGSVRGLVIYMRVLEIILIILLLILSLQLLLPPIMRKVEKRVVMGWMSVASITIILIHMIFEGMRWQMLPIYVPLLVLFVYELMQFRSIFKQRDVESSVSTGKPPRKKLGAGILVLTLILVGTSFTLDYFLPVFELPDPTGEYSVGCHFLKFRDRIFYHDCIQTSNLWRKV